MRVKHSEEYAKKLLDDRAAKAAKKKDKGGDKGMYVCMYVCMYKLLSYD